MPVEIDIISKMSELYPHLKETEKRIANCIMSNPSFASTASITELAESAKVSEASVTRFTKTIGCQNIRELKIKIAKAVAIGQRFINEHLDETGIGGIYDSARNIIQKNRQTLSEDLLNKVCRVILDARQVIVIGMGGGSTVLSQELQYRLFRLGIVVTSYNDGLLTRMVASTVEKNDVFIALSVSGATPEIIESVQIAKQYGAKVISITNDNTELSKVSHYTLPIISEENDYIYKASPSRYAMLVTIDCLAYRLAVIKKPYSRDKLRRLKLTLDNHRPGGSRQPLGD